MRRVRELNVKILLLRKYSARTLRMRTVSDYPLKVLVYNRVRPFIVSDHRSFSLLAVVGGRWTELRCEVTVSCGV